MKRFHLPIDDSKITVAHYLVAIAAVLMTLFFLGPIAMSFFVDTSLKSTIESESFSTLQQTLSKNKFLMMNMLPFVLGFVCLIVVAKLILKRSFKSLITIREQFDFKRFFFAFCFWFGLLLLAFLVQYFSEKSPILWNFKQSQFITLFVISIMIIPIQTGFEEIFFRGLILQFLGKFITSPWIIIVLVGLIFGGMHGTNPEVQQLGYYALVFYVASGVFTTLLTILDDGLELSWGFHLANNFFTLVVLSNSWQAIQTDSLFLDTSTPTAGNEIFVTLGLFYPLFLFVSHRIFKWGNWKNKLFNQAK